MNNSMRYHGLDALRAFAMLMGVVLHASMFYVEGIGAELGYELTGRILIPTSETLGLRPRLCLMTSSLSVRIP